MNEPKNFSDLGIKTDVKRFLGDKIKIDRVLNVPILISQYKIEPSKYPDKGTGKRLVLQIRHNNEDRIIFTGSTGLMEVIQRIPPGAFPIKTTIKKVNEYFEFT